MPRKLRLGIGAKCTVKTKYMHPAKTVSDKYPNYTAQSVMENLLTIRTEIKKVNRRDQACVIFRHDDFEGTELHCVTRWAKVVEQGAAEHFFENEGNTAATANDGAPNQADAPEEVPLGEEIFRAGDNAEDIALVRGQGLNVDDDNEPAPENVRELTQENEQEVNAEDEPWGWNGQDHRKIFGAQDQAASLTGLIGLTLEVIGYVSMFLIFFSKSLY